MKGCSVKTGNALCISTLFVVTELNSGSIFASLLGMTRLPNKGSRLGTTRVTWYIPTPFHALPDSCQCHLSCSLIVLYSFACKGTKNNWYMQIYFCFLCIFTFDFCGISLPIFVAFYFLFLWYAIYCNFTCFRHWLRKGAFFYALTSKKRAVYLHISNFCCTFAPAKV